MQSSTIPSAVRRRGLVFTSTLDGAEVSVAFERLRRTLDEHGATPAQVVGMSAHLADWSQHDAVLAAARAAAIPTGGLRVTPMPLPDGVAVQLQALACADATDGRPFMTAAVGAKTLGGEVRDEIAGALDAVCARVVEAGGSPDDLVHLWTFARSGIVADDFTPSWVARFPTFGDRPARKTWMRLERPFGAERIVFQATAMIGGRKRSNYEVFGVRHQEPLPLGARVGALFMSSGIPGTDPHATDEGGIGPFPPTLERQCANAFTALESMMRDAGGTLDNVALLGAILTDPADLQGLHREIADRWGPERRPALQLWSLPPTNPNQRIQLFASAVF
jgi:enamine deaminase RidA (YjgF/YER057c/UK114 family)